MLWRRSSRFRSSHSKGPPDSSDSELVQCRTKVNSKSDSNDASMEICGLAFECWLVTVLQRFGPAAVGSLMTD